MLGNLKSGRLRFNIGVLLPGTIALTGVLLFLPVPGLVQEVTAATTPESQSGADKGKLTKVCKTDIRRFCDQANLKQECLVAHWDKLSADCRSVLGSSAGNRADDGS